MLLADSVCASTPFTNAFRTEIAAVLPNAKIEEIPVDDPIFTAGEYGGFDIREVTLREPAGGRWSARGPQAKDPAETRGDPDRRPLSGDLLAVRSLLCAREAKLARVHRLQPRGCREDRSQRAALLAEPLSRTGFSLSHVDRFQSSPLRPEADLMPRRIESYRTQAFCTALALCANSFHRVVCVDSPVCMAVHADVNDTRLFHQTSTAFLQACSASLLHKS